jgi:hypothetical protein
MCYKTDIRGDGNIHPDLVEAITIISMLYFCGWYNCNVSRPSGCKHISHSPRPWPVSGIHSTVTGRAVDIKETIKMAVCITCHSVTTTREVRPAIE